MHPQSSEKPWVDVGFLRLLEGVGFPVIWERRVESGCGEAHDPDIRMYVACPLCSFRTSSFRFGAAAACLGDVWGSSSGLAL